LTPYLKTIIRPGVDLLLGSLFNALVREARQDTTTQLRCLKLIDRVLRHLVAMEVRKDNPASLMLVGQAWPEDESTPVFHRRKTTNARKMCVSRQRMLRSKSFEAW